VRAATPADTGAILPLLSESLGDGPVTRDVGYWDWKHIHNPFGPSPCLVAESPDGIVGVRAFMRWKLRVNGSGVAAVRAVDTATHPKWRHRGIFARLTQALLRQMQQEGVALVFNTPNEHSRAGYLKMGWHNLGRTSLWLRPMRAFASVRVRSDPASAAQLVADPWLGAWLQSVRTDATRLATHSTLEYLTWRYVNVPGLLYSAVWQLQGSDGAAVICREKLHARGKELRVSELLLGATPKSGSIAVDVVRRALKASDANFASAMAPLSSSEGRVLARAGFIPTPHCGPVFTVRPLTISSSGPDPLRRRSWGLSIGTLELF
jgi:GNAT superfamily N-acetyltransferase